MSYMKWIFTLLFLTVTCLCHAQMTIPVSDMDEQLQQVFSSDLENYDTSWFNVREYAKSILNDTSKERSKNANLVLAFLELYQNHYDSAAGYFKRALHIDSNCYQCYIKLHWIYYYIKHDYKNTNRLSKAGIRTYENLIQTDISNVITWSRLFNMYALREYDQTPAKKKRQDELSLKRVSLDSTNANYLWEHSFHCSKAEKEHYLRKAYELMPEEPIYWNALAFCYLEKKDFGNCMKIIDDVEATENHSGYWFQQKAYYLYKFGKLKEAQQVKKEAKKYGEDIIYKL